MMELGCFDAGVPDDACRAFLDTVERTTQLAPSQVQPGLDKLSLTPLPAVSGALTVAEVQQSLRDIGFFPGGQVDGIYGYRTRSAVRLFQEYVRAVEGQACTPDGQFGPKTQEHLLRWRESKLTPAWTPTVDAWRAGAPGGEFVEWLSWLAGVKERAISSPGAALQKVNAFPGGTSTRKPAVWDFAPTAGAQLLGIRRQQFNGKFDDVFVLLLKGLVFKFQGSTEPGASDNAGGPPYLVPGQHDFHVGWHKKSYLALRPDDPGVLVVRAGSDRRLTADDWARGLEANKTINIHWGGRGMHRPVGSWSEGCQVINGSVYANWTGELVDCSSYAATTPDEASTNPAKTRGAYNVLVDLITALGSDLPGLSLKYTLVEEAELALAPKLVERLEQARAGLVQIAASHG